MPSNSRRGITVPSVAHAAQFARKYGPCTMLLLVGLAPCCSTWAAETVAVIETDSLRLAVNSDGRVVEFLDRRSGQNYVAAAGSACASVRKGGQLLPATTLSVAGGQWQLQFGESGIEAVLRPSARPRHIVWEVVSLQRRRYRGIRVLRHTANVAGPAC